MKKLPSVYQNFILKKKKSVYLKFIPADYRRTPPFRVQKLSSH